MILNIEKCYSLLPRREGGRTYIENNSQKCSFGHPVFSSILLLFSTFYAQNCLQNVSKGLKNPRSLNMSLKSCLF